MQNFVVKNERKMQNFVVTQQMFPAFKLGGDENCLIGFLRA